MPRIADWITKLESSHPRAFMRLCNACLTILCGSMVFIVGWSLYVLTIFLLATGSLTYLILFSLIWLWLGATFIMFIFLTAYAIHLFINS